MNDNIKITLRLWFFELNLKTIPKDSFVGKRNVAFSLKTGRCSDFNTSQTE